MVESKEKLLEMVMVRSWGCKLENNALKKLVDQPVESFVRSGYEGKFSRSYPRYVAT
jgi:hypothetical protein